MGSINFSGREKIIQRLIDDVNNLQGGSVEDVKVNGSSVVDADRIANVSVPYDLKDLNDDETHRVVTDTEKSNWDAKADISDITSAIESLDSSISGTPGSGKTLTALSEADGVVSATFGDISINSSQISDIKNTYDGTSTDAISGMGVKAALDTLPEPMVFKGSLGTGGTIADLPMDGSATIGDTYKVITEGDYGNNTYHAEVGDTFICDSKTSSANTWTLIPSGDEPSGTVTSVKIQATSPIAVDNSSAITESGTRTISHETSGVTANSYGDSSAQTPSFGGTFKVTSATVNATGHVTAMSDHNVTIPSAVATTSANGLMSSTDKTNLDSYRAVSEIRLTNEDLNNVTTPGFYYAAGGNTVTNKPSGYNNFGLVVIHNANGSQYTQIISNEDGSYRRTKKSNATWTSWTKDVVSSDIPDELADLADDSTHRLVTDVEKSTWTDDRAVKLQLASDADLNDIVTPGFYVAPSGNTITNKPSGFSQFGLIVVKNATSSNQYYIQILLRPNEAGEEYRRTSVRKNVEGSYVQVWSDWIKSELTDENVKQKVFFTAPDSSYPLLMSNSDTSSVVEETSSVWKDSGIKYNPYSRKLIVDSTIQAYTATFSEFITGQYLFGSIGNMKALLEADSNASSTVFSKLPLVTGSLASETNTDILGSKNLIPIRTYHTNGRTNNGATFIVNEDNSITVNRSTTTGTATFYLTEAKVNGGLFLPNGTYYASGCPAGGSTSTSSGYQLGIRYIKNGTTVTSVNDGGSGVTFTIDGDDFSNDGAWVRVSIVLRAGSSATDQVWKPMVMLASLADKTYTQPARSNAQLTFDKFDCSCVADIELSNVATKAYAINDYVSLQGKLYRVTQAISIGDPIISKSSLTTVGAELKAIRNALNI